MVKWLLDQRANLHSELLKRELLQTSSIWIQPVDLLCLHIFNSTIALSYPIENTCSGRPRTTTSMGTAIAMRAWVLKPWVQRQTTGAVATGRWTPTWAAWWTLWTTWWGTMGWDLVFVFVFGQVEHRNSNFHICVVPIDLSCEIILHILRMTWFW